MGVEAITVSLAPDVLEAQQRDMGPSPCPAIGPSPLDNSDRAAITITRGQGLGQAVACPGLWINRDPAHRAAPSRQVEPPPGSRARRPGMPPHLGGILRQFVLVHEDFRPLDVAGIEGMRRP